MKQVIIDRGIYKLGIHHANGEKTEPNWNSDITGNALVIGHEDEPFSISDINNVEFILKELSNKLNLNLISKVVKEESEGYYSCSRCNEVFNNQESLDNEMKFCYKCGAVLDWSDVTNKKYDE